MRTHAAILTGLVLMAAGRTFAEEPADTIATVAHEVVVQGNNQFALELYHKLRSGDGNLFFSPYSISTALGMTYAGARGATENQMAAALCLPTSAGTWEKLGATAAPMTQKEYAHLFGRLMKELNARGSTDEIQLSVANALWGQKDYAFLPAFVELVETEYDGRLQEMDFVRAAEQARQTINTWVEKETRGKIKDLISAGLLNAMTRLVLTNAIYFKGNWARQFKEEGTRPEPFTLLDGDKTNVPMMNQRDEFRYAETEELQVLELPYVGDELSMLILLPKAIDGIGPIEEKLTRANLSTWLENLRQREVIVSVPKFRTTSKFNLQNVLASMGMPQAFTSTADFSGMTGTRDLFISAVVHQAYVDVNEEGTEAAAATGVVVRLTSVQPDRTPVFRADHPFVFMIRDNPSDSILFLGRVMNPQPEK
ncbi:MAG: serpin family protein [Planctomycetota bacterium]|jgi:serpin B